MLSKKMIVITKADGSIVGAMPPTTVAPKGEATCGLVPGPGEKMHEIDVPHELSNTIDGEKLHAALKQHLTKKP